ncbi:exopolyphosphatase [Coprinopsis sp. MPI-PUGE-AT-0042]|nr:exopolyphosphatase [Coprinopsis sp. MPI-PUGE-AT-0042]
MANSLRTGISHQALPLSDYLLKSKRSFLDDIKVADGGKKWTVVMGNEAGDLDSIASAVSYAWYMSEVNQQPAVPLVQIAKEDFILREENLYALKLAGIPDALEYLLSVSDIEHVRPFPADKLVLVDHNQLGSQYLTPQTKVVAVIDHHEDEGFYKDSAEPRLIRPCGSCTSLVSSFLPSDLPGPIATLLLSGIVIDTNGLKPGGKATQDDRAAALFLAPLSTLGIPSSNLTDDDAPPINEIAAIKALNKDLQAKKSDVSRLGGWDLLRRDYKEYSFTLGWAEGRPTIKVGLSTVPAQLKSWGSDGRLEAEGLAWMRKRGLTVLGVLTSFDKIKKEDRAKGKKKGERTREMAWIVLDNRAVEPVALAERLWAGIEADPVLRAKAAKGKWLGDRALLPGKSQIKVYKQQNAEATRKAVAPLTKSILEGRDQPKDESTANSSNPTPTDTGKL